MQSTRDTKEILNDILSGDVHKVWKSSCEIVKLSQDARVKELVPYIDEIIDKTKNLQMGGIWAPNKRFVDKAIRVLEFYKTETGCACCLLGEDDNPKELNTINIQEKVKCKNSNYVDYYIVQCVKCNKCFKVIENEYHYRWWEWQDISFKY